MILISGVRVKPLLTIISVNYNSQHFKEIVIKHLKSLSHIPLPKEIIILDNGSEDSSFQLILETISDLSSEITNTLYKVVRLSKNFGFLRAINIGLKLMDKDSKFVMIINNDCIVLPESIPRLIKVLQSIDKIGCLACKISHLKNEDLIDSAGCMLTEFGDWIKVGYSLKKLLFNMPYLVTYPHAALTICRKDVIQEGFISFFKEFADDFELGPRLYMYGYVVLYYPLECCKHYGSATYEFNRELGEERRFWQTIGETAIVRIVNSLTLRNILLSTLRIILSLILTTIVKRDKVGTFGIVTGLAVGFKLRLKRLKEMRTRKTRLDMPLLKIRLRDLPFMFEPKRRRIIYLKAILSYMKRHRLNIR